jgi:iron-sulfur cluster assembly protein
MITREMTIGKVVDEYPQVVETLLSYGVHCVGCHVSKTESLEDGLASHGMSEEKIDEIVKRLNEVLNKSLASEKVLLTENAIKKLKQLLPAENKKGLRVKVKKGGCSGLSYVFSLEDDVHDDDVTFEYEGVKVFVDKESFEKVKGSEIDYKDSLQGAGFKVQNPNAKANCGCGKSFN